MWNVQLKEIVRQVFAGRVVRVHITCRHGLLALVPFPPGEFSGACWGPTMLLTPKGILRFELHGAAFVSVGNDLVVSALRVLEIKHCDSLRGLTSPTEGF